MNIIRLSNQLETSFSSTIQINNSHALDSEENLEQGSQMETKHLIALLLMATFLTQSVMVSMVFWKHTNTL